MKIDAKTLVLLGVIAVLLLFWFDSCESKKVAEEQAIEFSNYKDTVMEYKARNGEQIAYNKAIQLSEARFKALSDSMADVFRNIKLKEVQSYTKVITEFKVDTVTLEFHDTLPCADFLKPFTTDSLHYSLAGWITKKDITFSSISLRNDQSIIVGTKKNGLFKKNEYVVTVQNSNPYVTTTGLQNYTFKPDTKWYQRGWLKVMVGFVGGYATSSRLNR